MKNPTNSLHFTSFPLIFLTWILLGERRKGTNVLRCSLKAASMSLNLPSNLEVESVIKNYYFLLNWVTFLLLRVDICPKNKIFPFPLKSVPQHNTNINGEFVAQLLSFFLYFSSKIGKKQNFFQKFKHNYQTDFWLFPILQFAAQKAWTKCQFFRIFSLPFLRTSSMGASLPRVSRHLLAFANGYRTPVLT